MEKRPSFDGTTITVQAGETTTITDTNGVLSKYNSVNVTTNGITITHTKGNDYMTITVSEDCEIETYKISDAMMEEWGLIKEGTEDNDTTIYFEFENGVQNQLYAMNYNDPVTLSMTLNIELYGKLELSKLNTNGDLIDGAIFNITNSSGYNENVEVTNGKITIENLKKGTYYIKEVSSPTGYLLNTETYKVTIEANQTTQKAIVNNEPTGEITITKTDAETGNQDRIDGTSHHGDASLNGAVYTLYAKTDIYNKAGTVKYFSKDEEIAKFTFNEYGVASIEITNTSTSADLSINGSTLTGLPMGSYYSKETSVPTGYTEDENEYTYTLKYKDNTTEVITTSGTVTNTVQKAPFEVIKVSTNNNTIAETVAGAEFTAILTKYVDYYGSFEEALKHLDEYAEDEYSVFKTGDDGHGVSGLLAYGEYTVNETYTPSDEIETVEEFYVTIDKDSETPIKEFIVNDLPFEAYIKLQKQDKDTGKLVTYSNATFELYKLNEETNEWEQVKCKIGNQYFTSWTTDSEGVARTETKLESGTYKVEEIEIPTGFIELSEELIFEVNNRNKTLEYDEDWDAWITVTVENEQPTGTLKVNKIVTLNDDVDTSLLKDKEIDFTQISFELVAKEDIIDYADGSILYEAGSVIGTYNLEKDGTLEVKDLNMGQYYLRELTTIEGAVLDETKYEIIFKQTDTTTKEYVVELEIENFTSIIEISKQDITGEKELEGAKLTVLDENNEVIDTWTSTNKAHSIEGLVVGKTYTLIEEISPEGYTKATEIKFTVENTEVQKVVMIDKVVEVIKTDLVTGEELEGATLQVIDSDGNIIDTWTSTKEAHRITGLTEGETYTLTEISSPYGYEITESITFTVSEDKQTQTIEMKDMPILKNVKIIKIDSETKEIIKDKFTFAIYKDAECTELIEEVQSDKKEGTVTFENLRYGTYYIKEIKAPTDYELSDKVVKVEINDEGVFVDDEQIEEKDNTIEFTFENKKIEVPKTGDDSNLKLFAGLGLLSLLGITYIIIHNHKKNKDE